MIIESKDIVKNPDVSIAVITYNQEKYIEECIESVLNQKVNFTFELIIADDCSQDRTTEICLAYQEKHPKIVRVLLQEFNQGLLKNYRDVMSLCRGKYVAQCSGDDYWCDNSKIQKQFDILESKNGFGFVHTGFKFLFPNGKLKEMLGYSELSIKEGDVFEIAKYGPLGVASSIFFKRELLQFVNFDDFIKYNLSMEDYPMQAIFAKHTKFAHIPDITTVYRQVENSLGKPSDIQSKVKYLKGWYAVKKYLSILYPDEIDYSTQQENEAINYLYLKNYYKNFDYKNALSLLASFDLYKNKTFVKGLKNPLTFYLLCLYVKLWKRKSHY